MSKPMHLDRDFYGAVTVGERGQIVIPAEARKAFEISHGEKLLMFHHPGMPGLVIIKLDQFSAMLEHMKKLERLVESAGSEEQHDEDA